MFALIPDTDGHLFTHVRADGDKRTLCGKKVKALQRHDERPNATICERCLDAVNPRRAAELRMFPKVTSQRIPSGIRRVPEKPSKARKSLAGQRSLLGDGTYDEKGRLVKQEKAKEPQ
jgi:hypothetical protein